MNYNDFFENSLEKIKQDGRYRVFAHVDRHVEQFPVAQVTLDGITKNAVLWCSNDYLNMGHNKDVLKAMERVLGENGGGAGGTRNIAGTATHHEKLEQSLARWYNAESALVFTSGYVANEATLSTLGRNLPGCVIFSDEFNHASMIQGISHSKAQKFIFHHNDMDHLEELLKNIPLAIPKIIAAESVYSMEGSVAPLHKIRDLAKKYNALTYIDEVHAVGLYGKTGSGKIEELGLSGQFDIVQGTLGKAVGIIGGFIAGRKSLVDFVRSFAPGFIFTTSLPPFLAAGAFESVRILNTAETLRDRHKNVVSSTKQALRENGFAFHDADTHIIPLIIGSGKRCKDLAYKLFHDHDIYVQPINYPTVPVGTERFRLTPTPYHTENHIESLIQALKIIADSL